MKTIAKVIVGILLCASVNLVFSAPAMATHNRATQLSWVAGPGSTEVEFTIQFVARRSYYQPEPNVGDTLVDPHLNFGDGSYEEPSLTVVAVDGDVIYTEAHVDHTYPDAGSYVASMENCCRLSYSSGHVNNPDLNYAVHTLVDLARASASPRLAVAPIVYCRTSGTCSFAFSGSAASPGNHLRWRLAGASETGDSYFTQPGPPYAPNAASVDEAQGRMTWDTTGAQLSEPGLPSYYSTQVVAEEVTSSGEEVSNAAADFFIALDDTHTLQPDCEDSDENGSIDNDNDGLCDSWETSGIDGDDDGVVDLTLPGANPDHPDIYAEIDYMQDRKPNPASLADVEAAFDDHGVALHPEVDEEVPFFKYVKFGEDCDPCGSETTNFDDLKSAFSGTFSERTRSNAAAIEEARRFAYHYVLWGNELLNGPKGTSGVAELPGNDLLISLGRFNWRTGASHNGPPTERNEAGTFMHELGHNLGLQHGGGDSVNCKPNYVSVMNYTRQVSGAIPSPTLDYSESALPTLDEFHLDEALGVQGSFGEEIAYGPGPVRVAGASIGLDWDRSGAIAADVAADANYMSDVSGCQAHSPGENLYGYDDWSNLSLAFQATADFSDGVHSTVLLQEPEVSSDDLVSFDSDGDGVPNVQDPCPTKASDQADGCPLPSAPPQEQPRPPTGSSAPPTASTSQPAPKPHKCKRGFRRKLVKGKAKCVKVKKHKHRFERNRSVSS